MYSSIGCLFLDIVGPITHQVLWTKWSTARWRKFGKKKSFPFEQTRLEINTSGLKFNLLSIFDMSHDL